MSTRKSTRFKLKPPLWYHHTKDPSATTRSVPNEPSAELCEYGFACAMQCKDHKRSENHFVKQVSHSPQQSEATTVLGVSMSNVYLQDCGLADGSGADLAERLDK